MKNTCNEKSIEDLAVKISPGGTPKRKIKEYWTNGTIPWLKISDLNSDYIINSEEKITEQGLKESATRIFPKDSVVISIIGTLGKVGILGIPTSFSQSIVGIQPKIELIDPKYLYYYLKNSTSLIRSKSEKGTHENVNTKTIRKLLIKYGSMKSQKKIVSFLDKISKIQQKRKESIELVNQLIQSSFKKIIGEPSHLFKSYQMVTLESISEIRSGIAMNKNRREGENMIPYLTVRNLYREDFNLKDLRKLSVTNSDLQRWKLENGDLCILEGGDREDVGRTAVFQGNPSPCVHQNHIFRIRLNKKQFNPFFVSAFLNSNYMQKIFYNQTKETTGISSINKTQLGKITIPEVKIDKQDFFGKAYLNIKKLQKSLKGDLSIEELLPSISNKLFSFK